ncbi:MAG: hypothetical protein ACKO4Z_13880 [Planctomycetota bacterium]
MRRRCPILAVAAVAVVGLVPAVSFGQATLTELGAANAARNQMMSNSAGGAAAQAPTPTPAPAAPVVMAGQRPTYGMKYTLSYALVGMLFGLGMYLVCRPSNRNDCD